MNRRDILAMTAAGPVSATASSALPNRHGFELQGTYLDAAFTHPFGQVAREAACRHIEERVRHADRYWPVDNYRDRGVAAFARLINADPTDVAVVPSTMEGENLLGQALGLGPGAGVVTDALHYDASLVLYGELAQRGVPVDIVAPRGAAVSLDDLAQAITPTVRLVAVSLVSSSTGFMHDLRALCEIAHARGALVYADIIQAVGAIPVDVRETGVDFCCAGTYKWLMGDFGAAFLYVRRDRLDALHRVQVGWRQIETWSADHTLPLDPRGPVLDRYVLGSGAAGLFEVSTPAYGALAVAEATITDILRQTPAEIARRRRPLTDRLQQGFLKLGAIPLTPRETNSPIVAFALPDAKRRLEHPLSDARIKISLYPHRVRVSPSVYNTIDDVERLIDVTARVLG